MKIPHVDFYVKSCEFSHLNINSHVNLEHVNIHMRSHDLTLNHTCEFMWSFRKGRSAYRNRLQMMS